LPGFTRGRRRDVQFELDVLPHVAPEMHVLLAFPLVQAFDSPFPARAYPLAPTFVSGVPH
jgi:hypothetical protein